MSGRVYFAFFAPVVGSIVFTTLIPLAPVQTFLLLSSTSTFLFSGFVLFGIGILRTTFTHDDKAYNTRFLVYYALYLAFSCSSVLCMLLYPAQVAPDPEDLYPKTSVTPLYSITWALYGYVAIFSAVLTYHPLEELRKVVRRNRFIKDLRYNEEKEKQYSKNLANTVSQLSRHASRRQDNDSDCTSSESDNEEEASFYKEIPEKVYAFTDTFNGFLQSTGFMRDKNAQPSPVWWMFASLQFLVALLSGLSLASIDFFNFGHFEKFVGVFIFLVLFSTLLDITLEVTGKWKFLSDEAFDGLAVHQHARDSPYGKVELMSLFLYFLCVTCGGFAMLTNIRLSWLSGIFGLLSEALAILSFFVYKPKNTIKAETSLPTPGIGRFGVRIWLVAFKKLLPEFATIWNIATREPDLSEDSLLSADISAIDPSASTLSQPVEEPSLAPSNARGSSGSFSSGAGLKDKEFWDEDEYESDRHYIVDRNDRLSKDYATSAAEDSDYDDSYRRRVDSGYDSPVDRRRRSFADSDYLLQDEDYLRRGEAYLAPRSRAYSSDAESYKFSKLDVSDDEESSSDSELSHVGKGWYESDVSDDDLLRERKITRIRKDPSMPGVENKSELHRRSYKSVDPRTGKVMDTCRDTLTSTVQQRVNHRTKKIVSKKETVRRRRA